MKNIFIALKLKPVLHLYKHKIIQTVHYKI